MLSLTRDQQRAEHALANVKVLLDAVEKRTLDAGPDQKRKTKAKKYREEYLSYVNSLPANIVMNGLGQACAMLLAQAKGRSPEEDAHRLLNDHLRDWLCAGKHAVYSGQPNLVEAIISHGQRQYVQAQVEALAYLEWLKKFAQAYLAREDE